MGIELVVFATIFTLIVLLTGGPGNTGQNSQDLPLKDTPSLDADHNGGGFLLVMVSEATTRVEDGERQQKIFRGILVVGKREICQLIFAEDQRKTIFDPFPLPYTTVSIDQP